MTAWRRVPLAAVLDVIAPPEARPDIELTELPALDAEVPCAGRIRDVPCSHPAVWLVAATCADCRQRRTFTLCQAHLDWIRQKITDGYSFQLVCPGHSGEALDLTWRPL